MESVSPWCRLLKFILHTSSFDHMDTGRSVKSSKDLSPQILPANPFIVQQGYMEGFFFFFLLTTHLLFLAFLSFLMIQRIDTVANLLPAESCSPWRYYVMIWTFCMVSYDVVYMSSHTCVFRVISFHLVLEMSSLWGYF